MNQKNGEKGQSFLVLVLLVGGGVLLISIFLAFLATSFIDTSYGYQALAQAQATATGGAEDALLQLARNTNFSSGPYSVNGGTGTAAVTVSQNTPSAHLVTIVSSATVSDRTRNMTVIVGVNATTTQITVNSWQITQ